MEKGILIVLAGLPGSGKSTFAEKVKGEYDNVEIVSSDAIRGEKFGDESVQYDENVGLRRLRKKGVDTSKMSEEEYFKAIKSACNSLVFGEMNYRVRKFLGEGKIVIYDATNITLAGRKKILHNFAGLYRKSACVDFYTPYETVVSRDVGRSRTVGVEVIDRMAKGFEHVSENEEFDIIHKVN